MLNKLFRRSKAAPAKPASVPAPPIAVEPKKTRLDAFREELDNERETPHEVIEGNGSHTDWAAWTDAVEEQEKSFAPTVPMPLKPD